MSVPKEMLTKAKSVLAHAYAPYSNYSVAACVRSQSGDLFVGCNIENAVYPLGLCAETVAIANMVAAGEQMINEMLVFVADKLLPMPCGACRQRMVEFGTKTTKIHVCCAEDHFKTYTLAELLPLPFSNQNLK